MKQWTVQLQARAIQRSLTGESKKPVGSFQPMRGLAIAHQLMSFGALEETRQFLTAHVIGDNRPIQQLRLHLENMPPATAHRQEFLDDATSDVLMVPAPGNTRRPVLFVFCGHSQRFSVPLNLIHRWFAPLDAHIVYLKDFRRNFYLSGIVSLGAHYVRSIERLETIAAELNASGIRCAGHSAGTFGALNMGIDLGAERVLCMSGPTKLDRSLDDALDRLSRTGNSWHGPQTHGFDIREKLQTLEPATEIRCMFGGLNVTDRNEAENLSRLANVELVAVENWERHNLTEGLILSNTLSDHLSWVTGAA